MKQIGGGLKPLPPDNRDFKFGNIFGAVPLKELPDSFVYPVIKIEDQKNTDTCPAQASTSVREDQEMVDLEPLFSFAMAKKLEGSIDGWGTDLRTISLTHTTYGALEKKYSLYDIDTPRSTFANWLNWTKSQSEKAKEHLAKSFAFITPYAGMDLFDSIRMAIWTGRDKRQTVMTGALWREAWTYSTGILEPSSNINATPHAFKINGWKTINGKVYLLVS